MRSFFDAPSFRAPQLLRQSPTDLKRGLFLGSCFALALKANIEGPAGFEHDYVMYDGRADMQKLLARPLSEYDYLCVALAPRYLAPEDRFARIAFDDEAAFKALFDAACQNMFQQLDGVLRFASEQGKLTLVCDFLVPHQNPKGRLLRRHSYSNIAYFFSRLNEELENIVLSHKNCYILSLSEISATLGKMFIQDEIAWLFNHGTVLNDWDHEWDQERLEPQAPQSRQFLNLSGPFYQAVWNEIEAAIRIVRQQDAVKLVLVDLDDTLWRGVLAEGRMSAAPTEGWPIALAEALSYLRRRGVLLGIVSKNDADVIEARWPEIYGDVLRLDDFAVRKINWRPKPENVEEILGEVNLLPKNVLFIDDNPVERQAVADAFPGLRVLGSHPYYLKQILIAAPEMQVAAATSESSRRTEMVQAQVQREHSRKQQTRPEFLASLDLSLKVLPIQGLADERFPRAFELLNKTNQFNTTGVRWSVEDIARHFEGGGRIWAFEAADRFTRYGLIALGLVKGGELTQFVMSCRVIGMEIEKAALCVLERDAANQSGGRVSARYVETANNRLCRELFPDNGYAWAGDRFVKQADAPVVWPAHIKLDAGIS